MTTIAILGAAGRTGRLLIDQAKARGMKVRALARDASKLEGLGVEVVQGDATDGAALTKLFSGGTGAVLNALGNASMRVGGIHSRAMGPIVAAMKANGVKRYVGLTSGAAMLPGENFGFPVRMFLSLAGVFLRPYMEDKRAEVKALVDSDLEWTLLRIGGSLVDGEGQGLVIQLEMVPGFPTASQRPAVAAAMLDAVVNQKWIRQAPFAIGAK